VGSRKSLIDDSEVVGVQNETNREQERDGLTPLQRSIERAAAIYYGGCRWAARLVHRLERIRRGHAE
jgi:hypothetical protein